MMRFNYYNETIPNILDVLSSPAKMRLPERLMMYTLVVGLEPARVLEIGTDRGGTARIITEALHYVGRGKLVCIDPSPLWDADLDLIGRAQVTLITGRSPEALPDCFQAAGGLFDLVLIDGDHEYESVLADLKGVLPYMADGGHILLHDYRYTPVMRAIQDCLRDCATLIDGGALTTQSIEFNGTMQGGLYSLIVAMNKAGDVGHGQRSN